MAKATTTKIKKRNSPRYDVVIIHPDTQVTWAKVGETAWIAFNPHDKTTEHNEMWPGIGFQDKKSVDGVIKRLQVIAKSFENKT